MRARTIQPSLARKERIEENRRDDPPERPTPRVGVLVADDSDVFRHLLKRVLERDGRFEVVGEAKDGVEAVDLARDLQPDVIFLDLMMPKKDGATALREIRSVSPRSRIVVLTALERGRVGSLGADAYLEKGVPPSEIIRSVERLVEGT